MKNNILSLLAVALLLTTASCTIDVREDNDQPVNTGGGSTTTGSVLEGTGNLGGEISKDLLIKKGNYTLTGIVKVQPNVTLTIEAGANFTASTADVSGLVILKGGKINAIGTADLPIVFTSDKKTPGDWGGITLYGNAPIKAVNGATTALSEDGNNQYYGGDDANSSSGTMKFVRVEFGGRKIGDGSSETNTMTFYAVGAGTTLENLVSYKGTDDGYEFFGGTVSAKNLVSYGNSSSNVDNTAPKISNITLIRAAGTNPENAGSNEISAIQFKKQGTGIFSNVYVDGYKNIGTQKAFAVLIQDAGTETSQLVPGKIKVNPIFGSANNDNLGQYGYSFNTTNPLTYTNDSTVKKVVLTSGAWATVNGIDLLAALK